MLGSERGVARGQMKAASADTRRRQRRQVAAQRTRSAVVNESAEKTRRRASSLSGSPSSPPHRPSHLNGSPCRTDSRRLPRTARGGSAAVADRRRAALRGGGMVGRVGARATLWVGKGNQTNDPAVVNRRTREGCLDRIRVAWLSSSFSKYSAHPIYSSKLSQINRIL